MSRRFDSLYDSTIQTGTLSKSVSGMPESLYLNGAVLLVAGRAVGVIPFGNGICPGLWPIIDLGGRTTTGGQTTTGGEIVTGMCE